MYARIEIVVAFLVVNFFGLLVITQHHEVGFGPNLEEIDPTSLPDLCITSEAPENKRKTKIFETEVFRQPGNV